MREIDAVYEAAAGTYPLSEPWHRSFRVKLFALVSAPVLLVGAVYTVLQPAVYESGATVLMSRTEAFDAVSFEASPQLAAIQSRILLGPEIMSATSEALQDAAPGLNARELRMLLSVVPVTETNLLEMVARGPEPELLPIVVATWTDIYRDAREAEMRRSREQTAQMVTSELAQLDERVATARNELAAFRAQHSIVSLERQDNEAAARLKALNTAASNALEEEYRAKAYLETLQDGVGRGEQIIAAHEQGAIQDQMQELSDLRAEYAELKLRYTDEYISRQPQLREIPERIEELGGSLQERLSISQQTALANARQAYAAAVQNRREIDAQRQAHEQMAADFSNVYSRHEALVADLEQLEELHRTAQARLVKVELKKVDKYPQVTLVDGPALIPEKIGPDYLLLLGGTAGASLLLGILAVWLYSFLRPEREQPSHITLSGVHVHRAGQAAALGDGAHVDALTGEAPLKSLENAAPRPTSAEREN